MDSTKVTSQGKNPVFPNAMPISSSPEIPPSMNEGLEPIPPSTVTPVTSLQPTDPPSVPTAPPLLGAWAKKLILGDASASHQFSNSGEISKWPSLSEAKEIFMKQGHGLQNFKPVAMEDKQRFPWAAKMNPACRNLYRASEPEYLEDGTPKVTIPPEVMLQGIENQKDYILGQFYRCSPPSGGLIYAVFNKLWGRKCRITIRKLSETTYLFHVPDESSRTWVLQRGLWHVDDCLMFVAPWTPEASLDIPEIKTIPVWVTLKKIPNILYSIPGISHIASGLGAPMATHKPWLDPVSIGEAKILVEVELCKAFPSRIAAGDESGFISMVDVEYAWLPAKCSRCGQLGHKVKRCLQLEGSPKFVGKKTAEKETIFDNEIVKTSGQFPDSATATGKEKLNSPATIQVIEDVPARSVDLQVTSLDNNSESVDSSPKIAETLSTSASVHTHVEHRDEAEKVVFGLRSNKFAFLSYSEGDEPSSESEEDSESEEAQSDSEEKESMSKDFMTPLGQRILRERPVKPSAKAQEMVWQMVGRGRGNQGGRGNQYGRGNRGSRGNRGGCG